MKNETLSSLQDAVANFGLFGNNVEELKQACFDALRIPSIQSNIRGDIVDLVRKLSDAGVALSVKMDQATKLARTMK